MTDRAAWLERRRAGLGASDVAGVLGLSPWASPYSVWLSKVGVVDEVDGNDAMEFGTRAEPMLGKWFEDRSGLWIRGEQMECSKPGEPWMRCTVDGFVYEAHGGSDDIDSALGVAEWKTTADTPGEWEAQVPLHYQTQATWSLAVTGMEHLWYGVLHLAYGRPAFRIYEFKRDEDEERYVVAACRLFWEKYVLTGTPPPVDDHPATTSALKAQWPTAEGSVEADREARWLVQAINDHKERVKESEALLTAYENELRALLADREALVDGFTEKGKPIVLASWKSQTARRLDTDRLRAAWPDLVREFEKETTTRVLRVKPNKEK